MRELLGRVSVGRSGDGVEKLTFPGRSITNLGAIATKLMECVAFGASERSLQSQWTTARGLLSNMAMNLGEHH